MRTLLMGVAAIAMAASVSHAQPKNGNGNGNAKGKPAAAAQDNSGKRDKGNGGANAKQARQGQSAANGNGNRGAANRPASNNSAGNSNAQNSGQRASQAIRGNGNRNGNNADRNAVRQSSRGQDSRNVDLRVDNRDNRDNRGTGILPVLTGSRTLVQGCPPGLAKKRNGCQAPGQAKKNGSGYLQSLFGLGDRRSGNYFYRDGYLLQSGGSGISAWLPVLGGALSVGSQWPSGYTSSPLPTYYEDYYGLGGRDNYRYADRVVYRVDPETAAIQSVAALLTGDEFVVGQPAPAGYDVYNVPRNYRDQYYDVPGRNYRYSDGYVYEIDPETRLVAAAIELLV